MALISTQNFYFYFMGTQVLPPCDQGSSKDDFYAMLPDDVVNELKENEQQSLLTLLQNNNNLKEMSWGMWYCESSSASLTSADELYLWEKDGNKFNDSRFVDPLIEFGNNNGRVGVSLGGNPSSSAALVNPIAKLYNKPDDFISLIKSIKLKLDNNLDFIDIDIENPQMNEIDESWWRALNSTLISIRNDNTLENIEFRLTIPQSSTYWRGKMGYKSLIASEMLQTPAINHVNIMDMDTVGHSDPQIWVDWVIDTIDALSLEPSRVYVTFESINKAGETTVLFGDIVSQLVKKSVNKFALFTVVNDGIPKFELVTSNDYSNENRDTIRGLVHS
ncbi:MAG: hypothetical protein ACI86X_001289 [Moritella sp.]|jgi:hypothetical protein